MHWPCTGTSCHVRCCVWPLCVWLLHQFPSIMEREVCSSDLDTSSDRPNLSLPNHLALSSCPSPRLLGMHPAVLSGGSSCCSSLPGQQQGALAAQQDACQGRAVSLLTRLFLQKKKHNPNTLSHYCTCCGTESSCSFKACLSLFQIKIIQPMKNYKQRWHWVPQCILSIMGWLIGKPPPSPPVLHTSLVSMLYG